MKIAVLTSRYPTTEHPYAHMFVHSRSVQYRTWGHDVQVLVPARESQQYEIDGVTVTRAPARDLVRYLNGCDASVVHLLNHDPISDCDGGVLYEALLNRIRPTLFFIHGAEVQSYLKSRWMDVRLWSVLSLLRLAYRDMYRAPRMRETLIRFREMGEYCRFVTPSQWMRESAESDMGISLGENVYVIPNGIDTRRFAFEDRWEYNRRLLSMRPLYRNGKYGVDLLLDAAKHLNRTNCIRIVGTGPDRQWVVQKVRNSKVGAQLELVERFLSPSDIPEEHHRAGLYLGVTRMDAQGVSMCEAMASGLPVVSFRTCAIPEFIEDGVSGLLAEPYDIVAFAEKIAALQESSDLYRSVAEAARKRMEAIDIEKTCCLELNLLDWTGNTRAVA